MITQPSPDQVEDEEFEDLLADRSATPFQVSGGRGRRGLAVGLAVAMVAVLVLGLAWALSRPAPGPGESAAQYAQQPPVDEASEPAAAVGPRSRDWPVVGSPRHGPRRWSPTQASGFSRTNVGAALAAANISARLDPYRGPATYRSTRLRQTVGMSAAMAASMDAAYRRAASALGLGNGQPVPPAASPVAPIVGWRARGCRRACVVELLSEWPGRHVIFKVPVVWRDGDWRVRPVSTTQLFTLIDPAEPAGFTSFPAGGAR